MNTVKCHMRETSYVASAFVRGVISKERGFVRTEASPEKLRNLRQM